MPNRKTVAWLRERRRADCALSLLLCGLSLVAGLSLLLVVFCGFSVVSLVVAPRAMGGRHMSAGWPLGLTFLVAIVLLIDSRFSRRDDLSNVAVWLVRETLGLGPRLLLEAGRQAKQVLQLAFLDVRACSEILAWLAARNVSASSKDIQEAFPEANWRELSAQLRLVEGVLFLRADFGRVTLSQPLRLTLRRLLGQERARAESQKAPQPAAEPTPVHEPERLAPHEILGVSSSATLAEIKAAYRSRVKECHPDLFASMDLAARESAEQWTKALNAAYSILSAERRGRKP